MISTRLFFLLTFCVLTNTSDLLANDLSNSSFQRLSTEHGLSQKTVQTIYQDESGFIWLGTQEGLNKYDGKKITIFRNKVDITNSISNDFIRVITQDHVGNLWIGTNGGLNKYNPKNQSFERIQLNPNQDLRINALSVDRDGVIWVATDGDGIYLINPSNQASQAIKFVEFDNLIKEDIRDVTQDSRGRYWIGTDGNGVSLISTDKKSQIIFQHNLQDPNSLSNNRIRSIIEDSKGKIWIGTRGGGVSKYNEVTKDFDIYKNKINDPTSLSHNRVYSFLEDRTGNLWIATDAGISIYNQQANNFIRIEHHPSQQSSLSNNRVLSLHEDSTGLIWVGTLSGLNKWNPRTAKFVHYRFISEKEDSLSYNFVHGLEERSNGSIIVATYGGGLNELVPSDNKFKKIALTPTDTNKPIDNHLTTLLVDQTQNLWVGSVSQGVSVYSKDYSLLNSFSHNKEDNQSLSANGVTDILQDSDGEIWVSTYLGGLNRLLPNNKFQRYRASPETGLSNENIFQIMQDDEGYLWLSTDGGGIYKLDKSTGQFQQFSHSTNNSNSLSGNNITSIYQDTNGSFWIGTLGSGLNLWTTENRRKGINQFKRFNLDNGLNSSTINAITEDLNGNIWLSTNKGVSKLNPSNFNITNYNLADEIHGNEFNVGTYLRSSTGRLYFGGLGGISAFLPSEITENSNKPNLVLTEIKSEGRELNINKSLSALNELTLTHKDYLISFEFAALDYSQPNKNKYQYLLEGLDSDWVQTNTLNRATFTNLPSGSYVLKVKGSNNDGIWSDESINLKIKVLPAPWLSWWALSIYVSFFCLLLFFLIRSQAKKLANQEMFQQKVNDQVDEKTALYNKNFEHLAEQLEQLKFRSNIDTDTGIPNQKYLCDVVKANLQWINHFQNIDKTDLPKLGIALIELPRVGDNSAQYHDNFIEIVKHLRSAVEHMDTEYKLLVRWNQNQVGLMFYCNNESESERLLSLLSDQMNQLINEISQDLFVSGEIKIGYSLLPFSGVKQGTIETESLLMLTEHILYLVIKDGKESMVGVTGANVKINNMKFKQIMAANDLSALNEILIFASYL
jgi:ligand-binding sensor domain-containing protein/GGDEF domain-containing protein